MNRTVKMLLVCAVLGLGGCGDSGTRVEMPDEPVPPPPAAPQSVGAPPPTTPSVN